eukprot:2131635-Rhodomonas_salina.3
MRRQYTGVRRAVEELDYLADLVDDFLEVNQAFSALLSVECPASVRELAGRFHGMLPCSS